MNSHQSQSLAVKPLWKYRRRNFLLLEVLIAFAIVALAVLPLVYPHYYIYQKQRTFIHKINLDITVNQLYAHLMEKLYRNEILWSDIENSRTFPITILLSEVGINALPSFDGTYKFKIEKNKKNEQYGLYLVKLTFSFMPKKTGKIQEKPLEYTYDLFLSQLFQVAPKSQGKP